MLLVVVHQVYIMHMQKRQNVGNRTDGKKDEQSSMTLLAFSFRISLPLSRSTFTQ